MKYCASILAVPLLVFAGCGGGPADTADDSPWFEEVAQASGLDFVHESGADGRYLMPEIMTTGAALVDVDGDGDLDAYLVQGGRIDGPTAERPGNRLFLGRGDGTFEDATEGSGADDHGYGMAVTAGDFDGDGDLDLYVSNLGANALLRNDGTGRFEDVARAAGVAGDAWSVSAAFVDVDGDGDLDLFVANYIEWSLDGELVCDIAARGRDYCSPKSYDAPARDTLYENQGDGTFVDASVRAGLDAARGNGLGVVCADFDGDGVQEIFVANDGTPNQLWDPDPRGRLVDRALATGCAVDDQGRSKAGMGVAVADVDADGDEDLLVVNLTGEDDSFYRNDGGQFVDRTPAVGLAVVSRKHTRFGVALRDLDLDGHFDVFQANGGVARPDRDTGPDPYAEENALLRGGPDGRFTEVLPLGGTRAPLLATSRAAAFGDVDGDGDVDILVHNRDGAAHLLRNVAPRGGGWAGLDVRLASGAPAVGAALDVTVGGVTRRYEVRVAESYGAASSPVLHLGLGRAGAVERVDVRWPDGTTRTLEGLAAGRVHRLDP